MSIEEKKVLDYGIQQGVMANACRKIGELKNVVYYIYYIKKKDNKTFMPTGLPVGAKVENDKIELLDYEETFEVLDLFDREE